MLPLADGYKFDKQNKCLSRCHLKYICRTEYVVGLLDIDKNAQV